MQDYNLTLLPQSPFALPPGLFAQCRAKVRGLSPTTAACLPLFTTDYRTTENAYSAGVDFRFLPKTTLSYDQFLAYDKQDNITTDNNLNSLLARFCPCRFWNRLEHDGQLRRAQLRSRPQRRVLQTRDATEFCPIPALASRAIFRPPSISAFSPPISRTGNVRLRGLQLQQQSDSRFQRSPHRTDHSHRHSRQHHGGPAVAKRVSVNADWSGIYSVTEKFRILDSFRYDNWRIPGLWNAVEGNQFSGFRRGIPLYAPSDRAIYSRNFQHDLPRSLHCSNLPQHASGSGADI